MAGGVVDHCTLFPDAWWGEACCAPHDAAYGAGGSLLDFLHANLSLGACIASYGDPASVVSGIAAGIGTTIFGLHWWQKAKRKR